MRLTRITFQRFCLSMAALVLFTMTAAAQANNMQMRNEDGMTPLERSLNALGENIHFDDTTRYIRQAYKTIEMAEEENRPAMAAKAYKHLIYFLLVTADATRAYPEFEKLQELTTDNSIETEPLFTCWQNIIVNFFNENNPIQAMTEYNELYNLAKELDDNYGLACAYTAKGAISEYAYETGIENFKKALKYMNKSGHNEKEFYIYYQMADLAILNEKYDTALEFIEQMLEVNVKPDYLEFYANYLKLSIYIELQQQKEAKSVFMRMKQQWGSDDFYSQFRSQYALPMCLYLCKYGNVDEVNNYIGFITEPKEILQVQAAYNKAKGNYQEALRLLEKYDSLQQQTLIEGQRAKVANADAFYKNKELEERNLLLQSSNTKTRIIILCMMLVLVITVASYITYAIRRHNKRIMDERDNTEEQRKIAEEQRQVAEEQRHIAEEERNKAVLLSEMKTTFINNVSHEVRTPLNSIIGFNDLLNNSEYQFSDDERKEMLEGIHTQTIILTELLNKVILLSRLDGHDVQPANSQVRLCEILDSAITAVKRKLHPGVELIADEALATECVVNADMGLLTTAFINVLNNAVKFTLKGVVKVECSEYKESTDFSDESKTTKSVSVIITDTGPGVPKEAAEAIFERFEKLGRYEVGFGLGLSITREILTLLKGTIYLDTTYTKGARFIMTFPVS